MSETTEFRIGSEVACSDGACGELRRVVVDPVKRTVTHLVVEPRLRRRAGHLVPVDLVASTRKEIRLRCTKSEFNALDGADETQLLPGATGQWSYDQAQMRSLPYFELGLTSTGGIDDMSMDSGSPGGVATDVGDAMEMGAVPPSITTDRVPVGEVEVRRGDHVHATDGEIGRVKGLVIDPSDHQVTHVLLDEGHLWMRKPVAIPIGSVTGVDDGVRLNITKNDVQALPPVDLAHSE